MKYLKLRIAWSGVWGLVAVLLVGLWIRSYTIVDVVQCGGSTITQIASYQGWIHANRVSAPFIAYPGWLLSISIEEEIRLKGHWDSAPWGYMERNWFLREEHAILPHWAIAAFCGAIAIVPWLPVNWRFSLRTLLIATTLIAVVLSIIVWASR